MGIVNSLIIWATLNCILFVFQLIQSRITWLPESAAQHAQPPQPYNPHQPPYDPNQPGQYGPPPRYNTGLDVGSGSYIDQDDEDGTEDGSGSGDGPYMDNNNNQSREHIVYI